MLSEENTCTAYPDSSSDSHRKMAVSSSSHLLWGLGWNAQPQLGFQAAFKTSVFLSKTKATLHTGAVSLSPPLN